ncbi:hypothetical protein RBY4I_104 [Rhodobacterales bacterium Y4I]|nr:hypothetical protein RBY4I_104 [Rhodobacterales bacterium Y4I]
MKRRNGQCAIRRDGPDPAFLMAGAARYDSIPVRVSRPAARRR